MSPKSDSGRNMTAIESGEVEKWLDQNGTFFKDYFLRKVRDSTVYSSSNTFYVW